MTFNILNKRIFQTALKQHRAFTTTQARSVLFTAHNKIETSEVRNAHIAQLNSEKELILKVLESMPSKREAKSYIKRFDLKDERPKNCKTQFPVALISLTAPMLKEDVEKVSQTLACIKRMGIAPILVLENIDWKKNASSECLSTENFRELRQTMIQDGLAFCEMVEQQNVKTRLIPSGVFMSENIKNVSKVDLNPVLSSLRTDSIPVLLPISCTSTSNNFASNSLATLSALSKSFSRYNSDPAVLDGKVGNVIKVVVVNSRGGIPNSDNETINFVNLQDDLEGLALQAESWKGEAAPSWKRDLDLAYSSLAYLPATTSAVVLSASTIGSVINNLITDKPVVSPSLQSKGDSSCGFTVLRYGLKVGIHSSLETVNMEKLWNLMETSFGRKVDKARYLPRIESSLSHVIIAGDYQGLAIVTNEPGGVCYLDKFAVDPRSQGIGVADVLWQQLRQQCPNLMWRSRIDNGVNKWYFERSDGNIALSSDPWRMFWYGSAGLNRIRDYAYVAGIIPATFLPGGKGRTTGLPPK